MADAFKVSPFYLTRTGLIAIPRPIYFSVQFKHMVLGLHVILAAEEDRTSDLASLFLVDLPMGLPRLESFR